MLLAGARTASAQAARAGKSRAGRISQGLGWALLGLLAFLLVEVLFEAWVQIRLADRGGVDAQGNRIVTLPDWPKTLKNGVYLVLLALTAAKIAVDRRWRDFLTKVDVALAVLVVALLVAGFVGGSPLRLIGEGVYIYLRGVIVFYAWRAADPGWRRIRAVLVLLGAIIGVNAVIAIVQTIVGYDSYRALGWVNLTWARTNRAHALLDHPNHLGHLLSLTMLGLLAWFVTRKTIGWRWWALFIGLAIALSATQSRESLLGIVAGGVVIALLRLKAPAGADSDELHRLKAPAGADSDELHRPDGWPVVRVVAVALVLIVGFAAAQIAFSPANRAELQRRLGGVFSAFDVRSGQEGKGYCVAGSQGCDESNPNRVPQREIRVLYYQQGAKLWVKRPVFGYGVGQFGGIVATEHDARWYADPRFGPGGFNTYGFNAQQVDSFWLHLLVETGAVGALAYLVWLALLVAPFVTLALHRRRRSAGDAQRAPPAPPLHPFAYWAPAAVVFAVMIAFFSSSLEDPIFPAMLFTVLGVAWVLLRRGELTPPGSPDTVPDHPAAHPAAGPRSVPVDPRTGPAGLRRARTNRD
jgi:O-Antigen ligase